jgi:hypothetical protein
MNEGARQMNSIHNYSSAPMRLSPFGLQRISGGAANLRALQLMRRHPAGDVP